MTYKLSVVQGDIAKQSTVAIVNAANEQLFGGSGVAGAIFNAAGYDQMTEACQKIGYCETGDAVITPGFNLSAKFVIHAVGPVYGHNGGKDAELLQSCYWMSLARAEENNIRTITFPIISSGIYGYPKQDAITIAIQSVRDYFVENENSCISEVIFCAWSESDYEDIERTIDGK